MQREIIEKTVLLDWGRGIWPYRHEWWWGNLTAQVDGAGKLELHFKPIYDDYTENKLLVVDTRCNQVYGWFDGFAVTEEGRIEFHDLLAFIEHTVNRW